MKQIAYLIFSWNNLNWHQMRWNGDRNRWLIFLCFNFINPVKMIKQNQMEEIIVIE